MKYFPHEDGITHINIYTRGKTEFWETLAKQANSSFKMKTGCCVVSGLTKTFLQHWEVINV